MIACELHTLANLHSAGTDTNIIIVYFFYLHNITSYITNNTDRFDISNLFMLGCIMICVVSYSLR